MTDFKATVKIHFKIFGKKYDMDSYINYDGFDDGLDERVRKFFRESWEDAYEHYLTGQQEYEEKRWKEEIRKGEEAEYLRLKEKLKK